ncbi:MAG: phosphatidylserine decarboxylase [Dehalococcoidia bacterium]|nr:phosphatidylserine decarboxylase [Dehalococcoidia bacterium]
MNNKLLYTGIMFCLALMVLLTLPGPAAGVQREIADGIGSLKAGPGGHHPVVQQLVDMIASDAAFRAEMEAALLEQDASSYWFGKTLDDMYTFLDEWVVFLPTIDNARLYMDRFYEFADDGRGQRLAAQDPLRSWLYQFMLAVADFNDSLASVAAVPAWMADPRINIADFIVPSGGFCSFNEFFTRRLVPGVRPIDSPGDPAVFTSPADSSIMKIADKLTSITTIGVKGENLNIDELMGNDPLSKVFINGKAILCMLNTTDYHRYHAPVPGRIVSQRQMAGLYYGMDGGWVEYFFQHRRGYFVLDTERFGYVAMVCVGMFTISSVNFFTNHGQTVKKGDEMGNFAYGGSAIILLFEPGSVEFTVPLGGPPVHVSMGQTLARATSTPASTHQDISYPRITPSSAGVQAVPQTPVLLANIVVQSASLSAARVAPGIPLTVKVIAANRGMADGAMKLKLYVNGNEEGSKSIKIAADGTEPVAFSVSRDIPGTYSVYVGGVSAGSFVVEGSSDPHMILYLSAALILLALVLGSIYTLRRKSSQY